MINLIRAEFYRILRSRSFWVTFMVFLALIAAIGLSGLAGSIGVATSETIATAESIVKSGSSFQLASLQSGDTLLYFFLALITSIIAYDFTGQTAKNVLLRGTSRTSYYLSKLIVVSIICLAYVLVYSTLPFIIGTLMYGAGVEFETYDYGRIILAQLPIYLAIISLGVLLAMTVKRTGPIVAIYMASFMVPSLIITFLTQVDERFVKLFDYLLDIALRKVAFLTPITNDHLLFSYALGICAIIGTTALGIYLFQKSEIK